MDSQTAIVTPSQLTHFANNLEDSIKRLRSEGRSMKESTKDARAVWKDSKYDTFQKQLESCVEDLEKFNATGLRYVEFLHEKANLANKYLHRR